VCVCIYISLSECICIYIYIYIYICVCMYICIYNKTNMDQPLWVRKCREVLVRGSCNHFAVTADKRPCVLNGFAGLSLCVFVYMYIVTRLLSQGRVRLSEVFPTPTRRVSCYPRRVFKCSDFLADYSLVVTCLGFSMTPFGLVNGFINNPQFVTTFISQHVTDLHS
jgi:hypothetical protein